MLKIELIDIYFNRRLLLLCLVSRIKLSNGDNLRKQKICLTQEKIILLSKLSFSYGNKKPSHFHIKRYITRNSILPKIKVNDDNS